MPLAKGSSPEVISENIAELVRSGHEPAQAAAIAYRAARGEDSAAGICYRAGDSVLLLLRSATAGDYPHTWCFPGGGIETGETPEQAAIRESQEEIAYTPAEPFVTLDYDNGYMTFGINVSAAFTPALNEEHVGFVWAPLAALPQPLHPGVAATLARLPVQGFGMDDDRWVTVQPSGEHVLLGEGGEVKGGMGGKFTGGKMPEPKKGEGGSVKNGDAAHGAAKNTFSAEEKKAIKNYASDKTNPSKGQFRPAYQEINQSLRNSGEVPKQHQETVKALDKTFENAHVSESIEVYRGVEAGFASKLKPGVSFKDKGFSSTTTDPKVASEFAGAAGKKTIMKISVPKGAKALSVRNLSTYKNEQEILLNRGASYRVKGESTDDQGNRIVHVEYSG